MANKTSIIKPIRTGNIFVDEYWVLNGQLRKITYIGGIARIIKRNGVEYDTSAISDDLKRYDRYLERRKPFYDIRDKREREKRLAWLKVEMDIGAYSF